MLLVNKLTSPGGIRRLELWPDRVKITLSDRTEKVYVAVSAEDREINDNVRRSDNGTKETSHVIQG